MSHQSKPGAFASKFFDKSFYDKKKGNNNYRGSNSTNRWPNPNLICNNCNKVGHTVDRCFDIVGHPPNYKKPNGKNNVKFMSNNNVVSSNNATSESKPSYSTLPTLSNEQKQRLMNLLSDKPVQNVHANMAGWIIDCGANQHMTVSIKLLINIVDISNLGLTVGHPSGTQALITKIGDLKINDLITLYDVLVVPYYTDLKEKKIVGIGKQSKRLYLFDVDITCKAIQMKKGYKLLSVESQDNHVSKNLDDKGRVSSYNDDTESNHSDSEETDSVATSMEEETHPEGIGSLTYNHDDTGSGSDTNLNSNTDSTPVKFASIEP
nr:ribonuclease H-like domain-containing protein [Tanacetum cinerariifolium]